ncbi:MAG: acyltransferase [Candidatus Thorarchaeota archaeon]
MFSKLRISIYFLLTIVVFLFSFFPEYIVFYLFFNYAIKNIAIYFLSPLILTLAYIASIVIFGVLHSFFVVKTLLPTPKEGVYNHHTDEGRLMALRLISDSLMKSMIKFISWVPFVTNRILLPKLLRLYGLKTGKNVHLASDVYIDSALVEIGNNVFIGIRTTVSSHYNQDQNLILKKIVIGNDVTIGAHSIVAPGVKIGNNSVLGAFSFLVPDQIMEANSTYVGSPAKKINERSIKDQK